MTIIYNITNGDDDNENVDGEDEVSGEVEDLPTTPSTYTLPSDDILRAFIRSVQLEPPPVAKQPVTPTKKVVKGKKK